VPHFFPVGVAYTRQLRERAVLASFRFDRTDHAISWFVAVVRRGATE
jgi:hypothetical protein